MTCQGWEYCRALIEFVPESKRLNNPWDESTDQLWLLTPGEVELLPLSTLVESISGHVCLAEEIPEPRPLDTRFGYTAWGLRDHQLPRMPGVPAQ